MKDSRGETRRGEVLSDEDYLKCKYGPCVYDLVLRLQNLKI